MLIAVVACDHKRLIGRDGGLPWHCPGDLRYFKALTMGHQLLVGRRTFEGIVQHSGGPLPGRKHWVLSRQSPVEWPGVEVLHTVDPGLFAGEKIVFVIGGAAVYAACAAYLDAIYLSLIPGEYQGDLYLPDLGTGWALERVEQQEGFRLLVLRRDADSRFDWESFSAAAHVAKESEGAMK